MGNGRKKEGWTIDREEGVLEVGSGFFVYIFRTILILIFDQLKHMERLSIDRLIAGFIGCVHVSTSPVHILKCP